MIDSRDTIIEAQTEQIQALIFQVKARDQQIQIQTKQIKAQEETITLLEQKLEKLMTRINELEHKAKLNSSNSGKPPSTDGLAKKNTIPKSILAAHEKKKKKAKNTSRKEQNHLAQIENPDYVINHQAQSCRHCGTDLSRTPSEHFEKKQVFDIPKPRFEVTEHRIHSTLCPGCQRENVGVAPNHAKGHTQYGSHFAAFCIYLNTKHMIPYNRIAALSLEIFGRRVSEQVIINAIESFGKICEEALPTIEERIRSGAVKHQDESGLRVAGSLHWQLVASSESWTKYWVSKKRGEVMRNLTGILSRDCFAPYDSYNPDADMALCNAHLLRELEAIKKLPRQRWAGSMQKLLLMMKDEKARYVPNAKPIPKKRLDRLIARYDRLVQSCYERFVKPDSANSKVEKKAVALIGRLLTRKADILRFFMEPLAPFTNNAAENNIRMTKVRQKISGCFRTLAGAKTFSSIRSVIVTWSKQDRDIIDAIVEALQTGKIHFACA